MSHCYLMIKLSVYQIDNDVAQWIHSFLSNRIQIVALYGERDDLIYSTPVHIKSDFPQGTKLAPTQFKLYVNDAPEVVKNGLELYADDSKLFSPAASKENCSSLQDLNNLWLWAKTWMLKFNPCKCKALHLIPNNPCHSYHMIDSAGANMPLQSAEEEHDLGVIIDDKLKFHNHCWNQSAKANKVLGLIKHSVAICQLSGINMLHTTRVCSHLEFGISVVNPHLSVTWRWL
ncbi:uncharacterized protein LOC136041343 [Artemia franciscana]